MTNDTQPTDIFFTKNDTAVEDGKPGSSTGERLLARPSTIVWGGILLLIAAIAAAAVLVDAPVWTPRTFLWAIVGFGGLLVVAGVVGAVARMTTSRETPTTAPGKGPHPQ
jgi:hypothetical protein